VGRALDAQAAYGRALELAQSDAERQFIEGRLSELRSP
jgi:predicted RNA polymerase sigma factor